MNEVGMETVWGKNGKFFYVVALSSILGKGEELGQLMVNFIEIGSNDFIDSYPILETLPQKDFVKEYDRVFEHVEMDELIKKIRNYILEMNEAISDIAADSSWKRECFSLLYQKENNDPRHHLDRERVKSENDYAHGLYWIKAERARTFALKICRTKTDVDNYQKAMNTISELRNEFLELKLGVTLKKETK